MSSIDTKKGVRAVERERKCDYRSSSKEDVQVSQTLDTKNDTSHAIDKNMWTPILISVFCLKHTSMFTRGECDSHLSTPGEYDIHSW